MTGKRTSSVKRTPSLDDSDDEDDPYLYMTAIKGYQLPRPLSAQSQTLLWCVAIVYGVLYQSVLVVYHYCSIFIVVYMCLRCCTTWERGDSPHQCLWMILSLTIPHQVPLAVLTTTWRWGSAVKGQSIDTYMTLNVSSCVRCIVDFFKLYVYIIIIMSVLSSVGVIPLG